MKHVYLTVADVLLIHFTAVELSGGLHGVKNQGALESAVFRPQSGYYADLVEEAAALFESLVNNHPFHDANKRTGFIAANTFLRLNGFRIVASADAAEQFLLENLRAGTFRFEPICDWLRAHIKPL